MRGEERLLLQFVELWKDGEGRMIEVVRRCSYLCVEEVWDWVLSKEASNLEEGAGTICGSTLHKRRGEFCKDFTKALILIHVRL